MIDGEGKPNASQACQDAIGGLYPLAYAPKFVVKRGDIAID